MKLIGGGAHYQTAEPLGAEGDASCRNEIRLLGLSMRESPHGRRRRFHRRLIQASFGAASRQPQMISPAGATIILSARASSWRRGAYRCTRLMADVETGGEAEHHRHRPKPDGGGTDIGCGPCAGPRLKRSSRPGHRASSARDLYVAGPARLASYVFTRPDEALLGGESAVAVRPMAAHRPRKRRHSIARPCDDTATRARTPESDRAFWLAHMIRCRSAAIALAEAEARRYSRWRRGGGSAASIEMPPASHHAPSARQFKMPAPMHFRRLKRHGASS